MLVKVEIALALAFGGFAWLGWMNPYIGYGFLAMAAVLLLHIVFDYGRTRGRKAARGSVGSKADADSQVGETPYDLLSRGGQERRTAQGRIAITNMSQVHGHADDQGIMEAVRTGASFNAELCWKCGRPRFESMRDGDKPQE
jgi:hypothetical protein